MRTTPRRWRRLIIGLGLLVGLGGAAGLAVNLYGQVRLAGAEAGLAQVLDQHQLGHVRDALARPAPRRAWLAEAAAPDLAGDALLAACARTLDVWRSSVGDAKAGRADTVALESSDRPRPFGRYEAETPLMSEAVKLVNQLYQCGGLDLSSRGGGRLALETVEMLGALARDLERGPYLLPLSVGLYAEKRQLTLIERINESDLGPRERTRLERAVLTEDLGRSRREALASEALIASQYRASFHRPRSWAGRAVAFFVDPMIAAAHIDQISSLLRDERRRPGWPDALFVGADGLPGKWRRLLEAPDYVTRRRDNVRRLLTL